MINTQQSTKKRGKIELKYNNYCGLSWPPPTDIRHNNQPDQQSNKYMNKSGWRGMRGTPKSAKLPQKELMMQIYRVVLLVCISYKPKN
eukprot:scaffold14660_cov68-Cyclotella_meneghiniana.AAC.3